MTDGPSQIELHARGEAVRFAVHVTPRASRTAFGGVREGAVRLSVTAPPVEGEANEAVIRALAGRLGVGRRQVSLVSGDSGRRKVFEVAGLSLEDVRGRLEGGGA